MATLKSVEDKSKEGIPPIVWEKVWRSYELEKDQIQRFREEPIKEKEKEEKV